MYEKGFQPTYFRSPMAFELFYNGIPAIKVGLSVPIACRISRSNEILLWWKKSYCFIYYYYFNFCLYCLLFFSIVSYFTASPPRSSECVRRVLAAEPLGQYAAVPDCAPGRLEGANIRRKIFYFISFYYIFLFYSVFIYFLIYLFTIIYIYLFEQFLFLFLFYLFINFLLTRSAELIEHEEGDFLKYMHKIL